METPPTETMEGKVGFRDIYRAVGESEARLTALITAGAVAMTNSAADHEERLRDIEVHGSAGVARSSERITILEHKVETMETKALADASWLKGRAATIAVFVGLLAFLSTAVALVLNAVRLTELGL